MTGPTADPAVDRPGSDGEAPEPTPATAEPRDLPGSPLAALTLAPVPGLQAFGADAVGVCGPDGCWPAPAATAGDQHEDRPTA